MMTLWMFGACPPSTNLIQLLGEAGDEPCIGRRYRLPLVWRRGARQRGIPGERRGSDQKFAAIKHGDLLQWFETFVTNVTS